MPKYIIDFAADVACRSEGVEVEAESAEDAIAKARLLYQDEKPNLVADYDSGFINERIAMLQDESGEVIVEDLSLEPQRAAANAIWIVVRGESYVPEAFERRQDAEGFIEQNGDEYVSGPWEIQIAAPPTDDRGCYGVLNAIRAAHHFGQLVLPAEIVTRMKQVLAEAEAEHRLADSDAG